MSDEVDNAVAEQVSADPRMPKVGDRIADRYEVVELLGEGGFAAVYLAKDTLAGGRLAVKVLDPEKTRKAEYTDRFRQEVLLVRELNHPNTIKIWDFGTTRSGCPFFAMEYLEGEPLDALIHRTGGLEPRRALRITTQVLKSLAEAHDRQIIHRDLKPSNIMVCDVAGEEDFVKVLDFGIAKALAPDLSQVETQTGNFMCTPAYAAPEVLRGAKVSPAVDIYALGLILAEMLTGQRVMTAESVYEIVVAQLGDDPVPLPAELLSTPVAEILLRAVAKEPTHRFGHPREMLEALAQVDWPHTGPLPAPETPVVGVSQELVRAATGHRLRPASYAPSPTARPLVSDLETLAATPSPPHAPHRGDRLVRPLVFAAMGLAFVSMVTVVVVLVTARGGRDADAPEPASAARLEDRAIAGPTGEPAVSPEAVTTGAEILAPEPEPPVAEPPAAQAGVIVGLPSRPIGDVAPSPPDLVRADALPAQPTSPPEPRPMPSGAAAAAVSPGGRPGPVSPPTSPPLQQEPGIRRVHLSIASVPGDAEVVFESEVIGRTPFEGEIASELEEVTVELRRARYRSRTLRVDMAVGRQSFNERLRREEREPADLREDREEPAPSDPWDTVPRINIRPTEEP